MAETYKKQLASAKLETKSCTDTAADDSKFAALKKVLKSRASRLITMSKEIKTTMDKYSSMKSQMISWQNKYSTSQKELGECKAAEVSMKTQYTNYKTMIENMK